jgi:Icc protein
MIRILDIATEPLHRLRYLNARPGGGTETQWLDVQRATATGLPETLDALVIASDLQGIAPNGRLLGVHVAEVLAELTPQRTGALLCGDLYSVPLANKRGGFGDVSGVWRAFADTFVWVAGVAGNHDDVSDVSGAGRHLLDGDVVELDGLRIGGVGLICGNSTKPGRRDEEEQLARIELVTEAGTDVLLLHEGPAGDADQPGHPRIAPGAPLVLCGHVHWKRPLYTHAKGQVLNADARVIVLASP